MPVTPPSRRLSRIVVAFAAVLIACTADQRVTSPIKKGTPANPSIIIDGGHFLVCKNGGPAGTYHYSMSVTGGGNWTHTADLNDFTIEFNGTDPACRDDLFAAMDPETWPDGATATIAVTEAVPVGMRVDSMRIYSPIYGIWDPKVTGASTITKSVGFQDWYMAEFYNGIDDTPPPVASCVTITAVQGVAITPVTMTASGGSGGPFTFSATGLPDGITMASDGTISGTATVNGTFGYSVTVTDKNGHTGTVNCAVTVSPPPPPLVFANCVSFVAVEGVAITPVTMVGSGGAGGPYTFSATGLPDGVTISSSGTISGTPAVAGPYAYTVTVTDKAGNTGTVNCSVLVSPPPPPPTCLDPTATNYGGPLPCNYIPPCPAGSFTFSYSPSGDLMIKYDQFPAPNDNSYGVNAVGWGTRGHTFSDLTGSDHAGFQLIDPGGVVRLSFNVDYISANTAAPSGYASLGVTGGDGSMLVGTATGITATSSLARNLNNINIPGLFGAAHVQQFGSVNVLVNSPPTDPLHQTYVISDPTLVGWDFHDTYFVTISAAKLASIGFNPTTWTVAPNASQLHNSPAKPCPTTNTPGSVTIGKTEVHDKEVRVDLTNTGSADIFLSEVSVTWPAAVNGKLMKVKLEGDVVYDNPDIAGGSAHLLLAQLVKDQNKRKIPKGKTETVIFVFEKNADKNLTHYTSTVEFGTLSITILPP